MSNTFFRFKKFRVEQSVNAMKVCTDACLFGAWVTVHNATTVLDIGTGTGVLALMIAQRSSASITAVELMPESAEEAKRNVQASKWHESIRVVCGRIQEYAELVEEKFDVIVCNPPFYKNSLRSQHTTRRVAHHDDELSFSELLDCVQQLLMPLGTFAVLIPTLAVTEFIELAEERELHPKRILHIADVPDKPPIRSCIEFTFSQTEVDERTISIKDNEGCYTEEFIDLLEPYYLYL
ncbi:MAG: methyltransferase [Candidatus Kapabacteria bacterium]|nr:methyltransferase [Candidatus Kapabacteria bacterium]